ncbi:ribbon-helix-helix domain-containing protein, partial [Acinetobacter baumannii]
MMPPSWADGFEELLERKARMVRYTVHGQAKRTSLNLEKGFWEVLDREAALRGVSSDCFLTELIGRVLE